MPPEPFNYADLIGRHIQTRLDSFPPQLISRILEQSGLVLTDGIISAKNKAPLTDTHSLLYKKAIQEFLGKGAYEMTKMNFMMAGCRCSDCRGGLK